jgi:hypothetical protein
MGAATSGGARSQAGMNPRGSTPAPTGGGRAAVSY